jgi:hypothetical protein
MVMRRSVLPALLLALTLSACGFSDADGDGDGSAAPSTSSPATETAPAAEVTLNERGNIPVEFGEEITIRPAPAAEEPPMLTLSIEEVVVDPVCDDDSEVEPSNGHYVAFRMVATASEAFDPKVTTAIADYDFSVIGADGATFDPATVEGRACFGQPRLIQNARIGPGYRYEGWMVLDVPVTSGSLVYAPGGDGPDQWEWQF